MWKRYDTRVKDAPDSLGKSLVAARDPGDCVSALGDATNTLRPVKRLRLKNTIEGEKEGKENKSLQYLATLRDGAAGTPKREEH